MAWKHFKRDEFACNCCGANQINDRFVDELDEMREQLGFPFVIRSGYRCPAHNARVSETGENGPHTTGRAVDIAVNGANAYRLIAAAIQHGFTGIGVSQKGDHKRRYIHLDMLVDEGRFRPTVWSY